MIRSLDLASDTVSTIAGQAGVSGHQNSVGTNTMFISPNSFDMSSDGLTVVVADLPVHSIWLLQFGSTHARSATVSLLAGSETAGVQDCTGAAATFNEGRVAITPDGKSVADFRNHAIRSVNVSSGDSAQNVSG